MTLITQIIQNASKNSNKRMMRLTLARVLYVLMNIIISQVTINIKGICSKYLNKLELLHHTCMSTFKRSKGAVQVLDTAPAPPPATRCLHHIPVCLSSTVNSSGTVKFSPTSKICKSRRCWEMFHQPVILLKFYCSLLAPSAEVQDMLIPSQQFIYSH